MVNSVPCQLCKKPVLLEKARINEMGKAVHEECYIKTIQVSKTAQTGHPRKPGTASNPGAS
ncbi:MAG TPA: hypothetical protein VFA67_05975 [Candidatus Sulfotelmatobacter sp.]|nr:hypothetical protein [Candidatus Sulfotelmatobacter sp.]